MGEAGGGRRLQPGLGQGKLAARVAAMNEARDRMFPVWREIAKYVAPGRGLFDQATPGAGERRDRDLIDATPSLALGILTAGMHGGMTSPSKKWFRVVTADPELADQSDVRVWCDDVERLIYWVVGRSNFYSAVHSLYGELAAFGTAAMLVDEDDETTLTCRTFTAGEYALEFSPQGRPRAFCRQFWMTAAQIAEEFGSGSGQGPGPGSGQGPGEEEDEGENLPEPVKNALAGGKFMQWFLVNHLICPNGDYREDSPLARDMPYLSVCWMGGQGGQRAHENAWRPLRVAGYNEFPVIAPRWEALGADFYGRSPGWAALGEAKTLQEMRKDYLKAVKIGIQPPLWAPLTAKDQGVSLRPGEVTYSPADAAVRSLYNVRFDVPGQLGAMADSRAQINRVFYTDLFAMIAGMDNRDMTAREVAERHEEKMLLLGPVLERQESEMLTPFLNRAFMILDRAGMLPQPPESVRGQTLRFEYISLLAQAQQMVGLVAIDRLVGFAGGMAAADPAVLDKLDLDECVDQYAEMLGAPARVVRGDEVVEKMRAARAEGAAQERQAAQAQMLAGAAGTAAGAAKDLAAAPVQGGGSALDALIGGQGSGGGGM